MRHLFSDRKMGKAETGLEGNLVTTHEISNNNRIKSRKSKEKLSEAFEKIFKN